MSVYGRILHQRVTKVEAQLAASQKALDANQPSLLQQVITEGDRVLQPYMWDWILETTEPPQERDIISRVAKMLALYQGWNLVGGWREAPRYWWALKGCQLHGETINTDGLFYFFGCSRAEFDFLAENVKKKVWEEAVRRVTTVLRDHTASGFYRYEPEVARLHVAVVSSCNLPELLRPHVPPRKERAKGSKEALVAWLNAEFRRQRMKKE